MCDEMMRSGVRFLGDLDLDLRMGPCPFTANFNPFFGTDGDDIIQQPHPLFESTLSDFSFFIIFFFLSTKEKTWYVFSRDGNYPSLDTLVSFVVIPLL